MILFLMLAITVSDGPYDASADAAAEIRSAIATAQATNRHVLIQVGGNWCIWCKRLDKLLRENDACREALNSSYVLVHVNYSDENKNQAVMRDLGFPQRFGFPVWVVLDGQGKRLHIQDSGAMEAKRGTKHDPEKVLWVLNNWNPKAVDPATYTDED